ncbi:MAG TPA: preprotein translocase subunit SecG [Planctomycetota bacterium]|nr:preprotein translocase subunit SecG [Planctomycetota bacterium]
MESLVVGDAFPVVAGVMQDVAVVACRVVFFLSAVLLMVLVLLQEGKGGGLASALGGQGAETFGVATGGVNRITLWLAGIFLASAVGHVMAYKSAVQSVRDENRGKSGPVREVPGDGENIKFPVDDDQPPKKAEESPVKKDEPAKNEEAPPVKDAAPKEEAPR